jgi:large subunit ribosomal protein L21
LYAVIRVGGRQFTARENEVLEVPAMKAEVGETVTIEDVLYLSSADGVQVGRPKVEGARVSCKVLEHGRGPKVMVFRMKRRKDFRRKTGHRQAFTRLQVAEIAAG